MNASLCVTSKISTTSKVADSLENLATQIDDFAQRIEDMLTAVLGPAEEQYRPHLADIAKMDETASSSILIIRRGYLSLWRGGLF